MKWYFVLGVFLSVCVAVSMSQSSTTTPPPSTTTPTVEKECASLNATCETCTKHAKCLWCNTNPIKCIPYPVGQIIPSKEVCDLGEARWGVCWLNYKVLLIIMGVTAGVILLSLCCCIYCCCCRRKGGRARQLQQDDARYEREREERQARHTERRAERQTRVDEIRQKYGLKKDGDSRYKRFDNEA